MRILIIGAGPTGLGAAHRLHELGHEDFLLCDANPYFGGLATSFHDAKGFTWDLAVHVAHSHYHYVDRLMETLLPDGFYHHERRSWVREYGAWIPYPFQYNVRHLPEEARRECVEGLRALRRGPKPALQSLGEGGTTDNRPETEDQRPKTNSDSLSTVHLPATSPAGAPQQRFARGLCIARQAGRPVSTAHRSLSTVHRPPITFRDWILSTAGEGIAKHFMIPYNRKIWTVDPSEMNAHWLGDRVPATDFERVVRNIEQGIDDVAWGPNSTFQFPKQGGTGAIWKAMGERLPLENVRLSTRLVALDTQQRQARFSDGRTERYDHLISTMPLVQLTELVGNSEIHERAAGLRHTIVHVVGVAAPVPIPDVLRDKTWVYVPEDHLPFYRVTPFSIFSPSHTPDPDRFCSFLCEISRPAGDTTRTEDLVAPTLQGLREAGLIDIEPGKEHLYLMRAEFGYPIPTLERDDILNDVLPGLEALGISSRGRFGGWKYEVANMDHSIMQGVEAVERLLQGTEEMTLFQPHVVNAGKR